MDDTDLHSFGAHDPLNKIMKCGMFTNDQGDILIIHDQPIAQTVDWVEYRPSDQTFSLICENGSVQDLGIELDKKTKNNLSTGRGVKLAYIDGGTIQSVQTVHIIIQDY